MSGQTLSREQKLQFFVKQLSGSRSLDKDPIKPALREYSRRMFWPGSRVTDADVADHEREARLEKI